LLEPGATLRVEGSGFPVGETCELWLRGRSYRAGSSSMKVALGLRARALSEEDIAVALDSRALSALGGGHGTFEGDVQLAFRTAAGAQPLRGTRHIRLDFSSSPGAGPAHEQRLRERAARVLDFAGITLAEEEPTLSGLVVSSVRDADPAAVLGVRPGDVIVRSAGVSIHSLEDFAPPLNAQRIELYLRRGGQVAPLELGLLGLFAPDLSPEFSRLSALLFWLFAAVLLLAPWPPGVRSLAHGLFDSRHRPRSSLGLWTAQPTRSPARHRRARWVPSVPWVTGAVLPLGLSLAGVVLVCFRPPGLLAVRSLSVCLTLGALQIALSLMSGEGAPLSRLRAALGTAGQMSVMGVLIACACALVGTRSLDGIVEGQGAWPWCWALLQKPALLVAFPLYVACASRLRASPLQTWGMGGVQWLLLSERVLFNAVLCSLGVAIFAGGWQSPLGLATSGLVARLVGAVLFVLKTWGFAWLLRRVRRLGRGEALSWPALGLGCLGSVGLTALWLWLEPSPEVELAIARALAESLALAALVTALRLQRKAGANSDPKLREIV
jgi:hypothetical protein